jgi:Tol biopolymer transport system component
MRKIRTILLATCIFLVAFTAGCAGKWRTPFPDADIVFQTGDLDRPTLGFADADGMNYSFVRTGTYLIKPWWSDDGKTIYALARRASVIDGYLSVWKEGRRLKSCKEWWNTDAIGGIIEADNSTLALISVRDRILLVDVQRCEELKVLVDYVNTGAFIFGLSLSPDQKSFAYGLSRNYNSDTEAPEYSIIVQSMSGADPTEIGPGINPSWSPDGKQIAFIQLNGIYVMNSDGSNSRLVNNMDSYLGEMDGKFRDEAPYPRWSPDGKWLIFHSVHPASTSTYDQKIIKVELATGEEEIIANGGAYPYWR